jgi:succinate dehydrogenase / fumarate reductase cytochrome b subunit
MADASPGERARPLSPHVQVWRWHVTMFASILHRATGMALYVGALVLMAWALSLAAGPGAYGIFAAIAGSIIGKLVLIGLTLCVFFHLANGVRHLAWDAGYGFKPKTADATAWLAFGFAAVATLLLWTLILTGGGA